MRKMIITLVLIVNAISLFGQSRTEIYDYFMVPKEFVYNYTDEDGYTSTRRFTVKSAILNFKNDELVGFTLKSDGKAQASFNVYKFINNTPKGMQFWVDDSMQYFVTIVNHSEVEDGLAIVFTSNVNGSPIFGAHFKKRLTAEEKQLREEQERERQRQLEEQERERQRQIEEQERARKAKEKADSLVAVGKIKKYVERIDSSIIWTSIKKYNDEKYRKNAIVLRNTLSSKNKSGLPVFSTYIEQYHRISLLVDSVATKVIRIDTPVQLSTKKEYIVDGITYKPYNRNGFVNEMYVKSKLYAGYSNGIIMQRKKRNVTYKGVTGDYADKEINKEEIPSLVASKLQELIKTDGKYRVEYVFAEDRILSLSITKGKKLIYRQTYDSGGHLQRSGTLLTNPK